MKSLKLSIILIVLLQLIGCGKESPPMDKTRIVNILMDVHIAEGLINGHHPATMKDTLQKKYLVQVLDRWDTSLPEFEAALKYMHGDPDYMREIYETVQGKVNDFSLELDNLESTKRDLEAEKMHKEVEQKQDD